MSRRSRSCPMVVAPSLPDATRRDIWAQAGAMLLLSAVAAGPTKAAELDGELLTCLADAEALDSKSAVLVQGLSPCLPLQLAWHDAEALSGQAYALRDRATALPARTPEGVQAKAREVLRTLEPNGIASEMALSLARDVLGRAGA